MDFFRYFKLIDLVSFVLIFKALYAAVKYGLISEIIQGCAVVIATFFTFQYYPFFLKRFESALRQDYVHFLSFWVLLTAILIVFFVIRKLVVFLVHQPDNPGPAQRWAAVSIAIVRSMLLISVLVFGYSIAPVQSKLFSGSLSERVFKNHAPLMYMMLYKGYGKIRPDAVENKEVVDYYEIKDTVRRDSKKGE